MGPKHSRLRKVAASVVALATTTAIVLVVNQSSANAASMIITNVSITNLNSNRLLAVQNGSGPLAAGIVQQVDGSESGQRWDLLRSSADSGYTLIKNAKTSKCLDVKGGETVLQAEVIQAKCTGATSQLWKLKLVGTGTYTFTNKRSGMALDVRDKSKADGARLQQYSATGASNQAFRVVGKGGYTMPTDKSGQGAPVGDIKGIDTNWKQTYVQDFNRIATPTSFDSVYADSWCPYRDGEGGKYFKSALSAHDGYMDFSLDGTKGAGGSYGNTDHCATIYGRYSIRFKAVDAKGYGAAFMVWPNKDIWGNGEIDYPEGDFDSTFAVNQHDINCTTCVAVHQLRTGASWNVWHTATTEWLPGSVRYYLDDKLILTTTTKVPKPADHRMTIQMAPTAPNAEPGHLYIAWVAQWSPTAK